MTIDAGDPPPPTDLSVGVMFTPNPNLQTQTFDYFNDLGAIVNSFTLTTKVATGFDGTFSCSSGYFLNCTDSYNSMTGVLTYKFFNVNPSDGDENCGNADTEATEKEGIPACGTFHFTLTGWTDQTGLYNSDHPPVPVVGTFTTTPEPSMFALTGTALLLLIGFGSLRRRKAATASVR